MPSSFVVCPKLVKLPKTADRKPEPHQREALRSALTILKQTFGAHVSKGPVLLVASQQAVGAAVRIIREEPAFFARVLLFGDGVAELSTSFATLFGKQGGQRAVFVCESQTCVDVALHRALLVDRAGGEARAWRWPGAEQAPLFASDFWQAQVNWLTAGDERWSNGPRGAKLEP